MASNSRLSRLGNHVEILTGFPFKSAQFSDGEDDIRLVRGDNVAQQRIRWDNVKRWPSPISEEIRRFLLQPNDVVLAMDRPWIEAGLKFARVRESDAPSLLVQRVARLRARNGLTQSFLSLVIGTTAFTDYVRSVQTGTTVPHISSRQIADFEFELPSLRYQFKAAELIEALEDRIDLLRQTNATLEPIAQALFQSWFVDFDPVRAKAEGREPEGMDAETAALFPSEFEESELGLIPRGWQVQRLGDWLSVLETGRRPKGGVSGITSGIPSIGAESITRVGEYDFAKTKFIPEEFFARMKSGTLESKDVLLYKDGGKPGVFLPRVSMFGEGFPFDLCTINEHVFRLRIKPPFDQSFLYFWIWSEAVMHELKHRGGKAAIPGINQADVKEQKLLIPQAKILQRFNQVVEPLMAKILRNSKHAHCLSELRDTLLPRMISGKLRLPEAESIIEESLT